jgi:hypothetical protein
MTSTLIAPRPSGPFDDFDDAVVQVIIGGIVDVSFGSSSGRVGNGLRPGIAAELSELAETEGRAAVTEPLTVLLPSARRVELIDPEQVHESVRSWIVDGHGLARAFGSQCLFRVPVRRSVAATLPPHLVSYRDGVPYLYSIDPSGYPGGGEFVTALWRAGVEFPAVTPMSDFTVVEVGPGGLTVTHEGKFPAAVVRMVARHAGQPDRIAA